MRNINAAFSIGPQRVDKETHLLIVYIFYLTFDWNAKSAFPHESHLTRYDLECSKYFIEDGKHFDYFRLYIQVYFN